MLHNSEWQHSIRRWKYDYDGNSINSNSMAPNISWLVSVGVFIIQLTIPTFISSYGVLLMYLIENNYLTIWQGMLPPVTYIACKSFTDPICRNILSGQSIRSKNRVMYLVLVIATSIAVNMFLQSLLLQVFTIGIFGGVCSSVIVTQAEEVLDCHFPSQKGLTQVLNHVGGALGCFVMPLLVNGLIIHFGIHGSFLLQSGIILQGLIGASLLGPPRPDNSNHVLINRPRAYTVVNEVEMVNFASQNRGHSPLLSASRSWQNPSIDPQHNIPKNNSSFMIMRRKNMNGVDILPEIPEESEDSNCDSETSDDHVPCEIEKVTKLASPRSTQEEQPIEIHVASLAENRQPIHKKSLLKWRNMNLQSEHFGKDETLPGNNVPQINELNYIEEVREFPSFMNYGDNMRFQRLNSSSSSSGVIHSKSSVFQKIKYVVLCGCFSKGLFYEIYLTILNVPNDISFYMIWPLINALKVPDFFPAVYLYTIIRLCPIIFTTYIPFLIRRKIAASSTQEGAFAISVFAFTLLCFILISPCFIPAKLYMRKLIYFIGSMFLCTGFYLVTTSRNHSYIVLGCAFYGLGYGATSKTITITLEMDMGCRNFLKIQGPVDVLSGCFIIITSILLGCLLRNEDGIFNCFIIMSGLQLATNLIWIISLLKTMLYQLAHCSCHPTDDFLTPELNR